MTATEWFSSIGALISLFLGYVAAKGELDKLRRHRKLSRLLKEREFIEQMHSSPSLRIAYLVESVLITLGIASAAIMFSAIEVSAITNSKWEPDLRFIAGSFMYLFAMFRLGQYRNVTARYLKTIERINVEIARLQPQTPMTGSNSDEVK